MKQIPYIILMLALAGCTQNKSAMDDFYKVYGSELENIDTALEKLSARKIYFGHQSVGYDILSGMEQWEEETGIRVAKIETRDLADAGATGEASLVHFRVGENRDPYSKIEDFARLVRQIPKDEPSLALFKFCYIDFQPDADVDAIFETYREKMLELRDSSGNCRIVLCTVPVTAIQKGPKGLAKKILGMPLNHTRENIKREAFSERIRTELADEFPVFDLARVESTLPDGSTQTFKYQKKQHPRMPDSYTRDKGHLNPHGARIVSYSFIAFLSQL